MGRSMLNLVTGVIESWCSVFRVDFREGTFSSRHHIGLVNSRTMVGQYVQVQSLVSIEYGR